MNVAQACADCLEEAGGRQLQHKTEWDIAHCGCCGRRRAVTNPENFGSPRLTPKVLPLAEPAA